MDSEKRGLLGRYGRATASFLPQNENELPLEAGEVVEILGQHTTGWTFGCRHGRNGVFPANHIIELTEAESLQLSEEERPTPRGTVFACMEVSASL